jgi:hypothetical protein
MDFATRMLRVQVRGNDGDLFFEKMRLVCNHVLVTERDQVVNVVVFFNEFLRVDL